MNDQQKKIAELMDRHDIVVLQFSGGKDSTACLHLLEPWWDKVHVVWVNPGAPYPEMLEHAPHTGALKQGGVVQHRGGEAVLRLCYCQL